MKKKITMLALLMIITSKGLTYAETQNSIANYQDDSNVKIAASELLKDVLKQGIYSVGTMMLNRFSYPSNGSTYSVPTYSTTTTDSSTSSATSTPTTTEITPDQQEETVPVS